MECEPDGHSRTKAVARIPQWGGSGSGAKGSVLSDIVPLTKYGPLDGLNFEFRWEGDFLQTVLLSNVGKKRKNNEDSCLMCAPEEEALAHDRGLLFAVADGMGGASAGEYASRMALQVLAKSYFADLGAPIPQALRKAVETANIKIFEEAEVNPVYSGMGTTLSTVAVVGEWAYIAQVGDSRVYLLRERSGIHQLTDDHSLVAEQVRSGLISEEEARTHSLRNLITRAVGIKDVVSTDLFALHLRRGDTLLICSDGLCNMVPDNRIAEAMGAGDLTEGTQELIDLALAGGGTDNVTVLTFRVSSTPPRASLQEGAQEIALSSGGFLSKLKRLLS